MDDGILLEDWEGELEDDELNEEELFARMEYEEEQRLESLEDEIDRVFGYQPKQSGRSRNQRQRTWSRDYQNFLCPQPILLSEGEQNERLRRLKNHDDERRGQAHQPRYKNHRRTPQGKAVHLRTNALLHKSR